MQPVEQKHKTTIHYLIQNNSIILYISPSLNISSNESAHINDIRVVLGYKIIKNSIEFSYVMLNKYQSMKGKFDSSFLSLRTVLDSLDNGAKLFFLMNPSRCVWSLK